MTKPNSNSANSSWSGFDFMKSLGQSTASPWSAWAEPMASWILPTLDIKELQKRINDLKSIQFWLEQNLTGIKAALQVLEVQRMTLSTLQSMNAEPKAESSRQAQAFWEALSKQFQTITDQTLQEMARHAPTPQAQAPDQEKPATASKQTKTRKPRSK